MSIRIEVPLYRMPFLGLATCLRPEAGRKIQKNAYMDTSLIRNNPPKVPTVGPCLGPYGGLRGGGSFA